MDILYFFSLKKYKENHLGKTNKNIFATLIFFLDSFVTDADSNL